MSTTINNTNTDLSSIYYSYKNSSSLLDALNSTDAGITISASNAAAAKKISGITDLDSYVAEATSSVSSDSTYTASILKNNFHLNSLTNALSALSDTADFSGLSSIEDYAKNLINTSQGTEYEALSSASSGIGTFLNSTNLSQSVSDAYKSSSIIEKLKSNSLDIIT